MLTAQQIFDAVWRHFIHLEHAPGYEWVEPWEPTDSPDGLIRFPTYVGPCAVGIFLSTKERRAWDRFDYGIDELHGHLQCGSRPGWLSQPTSDLILHRHELLMALQASHDHAFEKTIPSFGACGGSEIQKFRDVFRHELVVLSNNPKWLFADDPKHRLRSRS